MDRKVLYAAFLFTEIKTFFFRPTLIICKKPKNCWIRAGANPRALPLTKGEVSTSTSHKIRQLP